MKKQYFFALVSILCWSTVATVTKLMMSELNSIQLLWISSLLASAFLLIINIFSGNMKILKNYKIMDYITIVLMGIPGTFFYYVFYYAGTERMAASQAFIVNYMWPIMSVLFACIILKEKMTFRKGIAIIVSFFGVVIVTGGELLQLDYNTVVGALFCIMGAVSYGIFTAFNQKFSYDKTVSMMMNFFVTFLLTTIMNVINGDIFVPDFVQLVGITWNGVFTMAIPCTMWIIALEGGNTAKISNLAYITPFLSLIWTSLILKEAITVNSIVGLVMIVLGIFIQIKGKPESSIEGGLYENRISD